MDDLSPFLTFPAQRWTRFLIVYFCFSNHDELLTSGAKIEKLIVSHPALSEPTDIQILYIAYEGWIYSGRLVWVRMTLEWYLTTEISGRCGVWRS